MAAPASGSRRVCPGCGEELEPRRANHVYHGEACRQRASYRRRREQRRPEEHDLAVLADTARELIRAGELSVDEALLYVISPTPAILDALRARRDSVAA